VISRKCSLVKSVIQFLLKKCGVIKLFDKIIARKLMSLLNALHMKLNFSLVICLLFFYLVFDSIGQTSPDFKLQIGHSDIVTSANFSPNGKFIVTLQWMEQVKCGIPNQVD
jgi:hypothetical protein